MKSDDFIDITDVVCPITFVKVKFDNFSYIIRLRNNMLMNFGGSVAPFNIFLTGIEIDTLELRRQRSCDNALKLAKFLSEQKNIQVNYHGLENNFYHELAKK